MRNLWRLQNMGGRMAWVFNSNFKLFFFVKSKNGSLQHREEAREKPTAIIIMIKGARVSERVIFSPSDRDDASSLSLFSSQAARLFRTE